ncbi:MAG: OmpW family outer membrane protein [Polaromonas sp.]
MIDVDHTVNIDSANSLKSYVGAGINYTHVSSASLPAGVDLDSNSWSLALQLGVDIPLDANLGTFKVDPVLFWVGLVWRFRVSCRLSKFYRACRG